jgi:hypothetical protein
MKKTMLNLTFAAALAAVAASVASAQTLKADIPFAFRAGDKVMSPGSYLVTLRGPNHNIVRLYNRDASESVLALGSAFADPAESWTASGAPVLAFECAGTRCALATIWSGGPHRALTIAHPKLAGGDQAAVRLIHLEKVNGD